MPYLFCGLVILNTVMLGYYVFLKQPLATESLKTAEAEISRPLTFINSAQHIPPPIGTKD